MPKPIPACLLTPVMRAIRPVRRPSIDDFYRTSTLSDVDNEQPRGRDASAARSDQPLSGGRYRHVGLQRPRLRGDRRGDARDHAALASSLSALAAVACNPPRPPRGDAPRPRRADQAESSTQAMTRLPDTDRTRLPLRKRGAIEGVARRHGRRRNPAWMTPRSSLRTPINQPLHHAQRWVEKCDRSIKGSDTHLADRRLRTNHWNTTINYQNQQTQSPSKSGQFIAIPERGWAEHPPSGRTALNMPAHRAART